MREGDLVDRTRAKCFGEPNMSDACAQCPDNDDCCDELKKRRAEEGQA